MGYSLGVDLGTTFVGVALVGDAKPEMVTLGGRSVVVPSVVYLGEDGRLLCGEVAQRRSIREPARTAKSFKRRLGDPVPVRLGDQNRSATELLAALLIDALRVVSETEGQDPERVMLTHPANWGRFRRGQLEEVGRLAGLDDVLMVEEPVAAASHYARTRTLREGQVVAVYDLGGGTFDVTVLRAAVDRVEILGTPEGIERLGGVDFDDALFAHIDHASDGAVTALDHRDPTAAAALARLRQECAAAKESLSTDSETVIPVFLPDRNFEIRVSRTQFEGLIRAHVESSVGALERTLRSAQVAPDEVDAVLLVGGSSRIPLVAEMVTEALGRPTVVDTHPKYAVALGAAALAGEAGLAGETGLSGEAGLSGDAGPVDEAERDGAAGSRPLASPPVVVKPTLPKAARFPPDAPADAAEPEPAAAEPVRAAGPTSLRVRADGRVSAVPPTQRFMIGRGDDVQLELSDPRVSRHHAVIASVNGTWTYTDMSRNGTFLGGEKVTRIRIVRPTVLLLGDRVLGVRVELTPEASPGAPVPELGRRDEPTALHDLTRGRLRIGRLPDNDIVLDDLMVSRTHAELLRSPGGWTLVDLGSGNGTFVNERRISAPTPITTADVVRLGHSVLQLDGDRLVERIASGGR